MESSFKVKLKNITWMSVFFHNLMFFLAHILLAGKTFYLINAVNRSSSHILLNWGSWSPMISSVTVVFSGIVMWPRVLLACLLLEFCCAAPHAHINRLALFPDKSAWCEAKNITQIVGHTGCTPRSIQNRSHTHTLLMLSSLGNSWTFLCVFVWPK